MSRHVRIDRQALGRFVDKLLGTQNLPEGHDGE